MDTNELLASGLSALAFPKEQIDCLSAQMMQYIGEIQLFNRAYNLVNTDDANKLAAAHILDSLAAVPALRPFFPHAADGTFCVGDIGSGGGLPGIPLAAAFPDTQFSLVERMDKRCAFLENCAAVLGLHNVQVIKSEAERVPPQSFSLTVFRAFRPFDEHFATALLSLTKDGGVLAAYKAKRESIQKEMANVKNLIPEYEIIPLTVPFLADVSDGEERERNLVIVRK